MEVCQTNVRPKQLGDLVDRAFYKGPTNHVIHENRLFGLIGKCCLANFDYPQRINRNVVAMIAVT